MRRRRSFRNWFLRRNWYLFRVETIARSSPIRATKRYPSGLSHPNKDDDQLGVKASFQKKGGAVIPLWLERARAGTEHRKCNYKTSCAGNPKNQKKLGCRECLLHLDCKGARWRCQIGAEALVVRVINVFSMRLAVVNAVFCEICLRDLVSEEM